MYSTIIRPSDGRNYSLDNYESTLILNIWDTEILLEITFFRIRFLIRSIYFYFFKTKCKIRGGDIKKIDYFL